MPVKLNRTTQRRAPFLGKEYFENLYNEIPEAIVIATNTGNIIRVNGEFSRMFGYTGEEARGQVIDDLIAPQERLKEATGVTHLVAHGQKIVREAVRQRKDGSLIHVSLLGLPIMTHDKQVAVYGIYRDISDRKQADEALKLEKALLAQLVETAAEGIVMLDPEGRITLHNSEFCRMFGFRPSEVEGRSIDELILPEELGEEGALLTRRVRGGATFTTETLRRRKDGSRIDVSIIGSPVVINGQQVGTYGIYRDISDIKKAQNEILESQRQVLEANATLQERTRQLEAANALLERLSNFDGLTGIPNRRYFERFYGLEWRRAAREKKWIALIMIDVDFFKAYNDRHGHPAGDACLKQISQALDQVVNRASDVVCRYGGEEFVVVLSGTDLTGAREVAERMAQRIRSLALAHGGTGLSALVTLSMGIASEIPQLSANPEELLLRADQALYLAKARGRDRIEVMA